MKKACYKNITVILERLKWGSNTLGKILLQSGSAVLVVKSSFDAR